MLSDEKREAYLDALAEERVGYEKRVETAKVVGDKAAVDRYQNRIQQVDAEIERVNAEESVETPGDDVDETSGKKNKQKA